MAKTLKQQKIEIGNHIAAIRADANRAVLPAGVADLDSHEKKLERTKRADLSDWFAKFDRAARKLLDHDPTHRHMVRHHLREIERIVSEGDDADAEATGNDETGEE